MDRKSFFLFIYGALAKTGGSPCFSGSATSRPVARMNARMNDPNRLRRNATEERSRRDFDSDSPRNSIKWELRDRYEKGYLSRVRVAAGKVLRERGDRPLVDFERLGMVDSRLREKRTLEAAREREGRKSRCPSNF